MTKVNYVIATYNGLCKRRHKYPSPEDILSSHLTNILKYKNSLTQITIMKAESTNFYKSYYDIENIIKCFNIPVIIIECENYGYSEGQWLKCYELFTNEFDYYLFIEDDYCPGMNNFDSILENIYKTKFCDNIGLLCSLVQGSADYNITNGKFPIHSEGSVFISRETLFSLYSHPYWEKTPRKFLDLINSSIDPKYNWENRKRVYEGAYYQLSFSNLFNLIDIKHECYLDIKSPTTNCLFTFPYWSDNPASPLGGVIVFYNKDDIQIPFRKSDIRNAIIIPIQLKDESSIKHNTRFNTRLLEEYNKKIIFIIGMHRCGTSLLSSCIVANGFSIGKSKNTDKNWQNPNGYFENDKFTEFHNELLNYNNSKWNSINETNMKYTQDHVDRYKLLLQEEFEDDKNILIKDPRLTFFTHFLQEVCKDNYEIHFIFAVRDREETCASLSKAQQISYENAADLYDKTLNKYDDKDYFKLDYKDTLFNNEIIMSRISAICKFELKTNTENLVDVDLYLNR